VLRHWGRFELRTVCYNREQANILQPEPVLPPRQQGAPSPDTAMATGRAGSLTHSIPLPSRNDAQKNSLLEPS
jgi:hypothetical protein